MRKNILLFAAALVVTLLFAVYQRHTAPTFPLKGEGRVGSLPVSYKFIRSQDVGKEAEVRVIAKDSSVEGTLAFRRYPTSDPFQTRAMRREGECLVSEMPSQPPAGKLEYQARLKKGDSFLVVPEDPAIIRFKGSVPAMVLVPHIILIFLGLLFAVKAALDSLTSMDPFTDSVVAFSMIMTGGMILGPVVQKYAFGAFWTGYPFGSDWTDNKTAAAALAWIIALVLMRVKGKTKKWAPLLACLATLAAFGIPHSFRGSQLDWSKIPVSP